MRRARSAQRTLAIAAVAALVAAAGCAGNGQSVPKDRQETDPRVPEDRQESDPGSPVNRPETSEETMTDSKQECRSEQDIVANFGKVCAVIGTYEVKEFTNKKGGKWRDWPVVVLSDGGRDVLIESIWDESKAPSPETVAQYRGRRVEVVGRLHAAPPGARANIAAPCVSPVDSIREIPD